MSICFGSLIMLVQKFFSRVGCIFSFFLFYLVDFSAYSAGSVWLCSVYSQSPMGIHARNTCSRKFTGEVKGRRIDEGGGVCDFETNVCMCVCVWLYHVYSVSHSWFGYS